MATWVNMTVRLPPEVRDWLKERAEQKHRSMNGELVSCLEAIKAGVNSGTPAAGQTYQA